MERNYDIFKRHPDGMFIWIETTGDLQAAEERLKQLAARSPGEYKVLCLNTLRVVASQRQVADAIGMLKRPAPKSIRMGVRSNEDAI